MYLNSAQSSIYEKFEQTHNLFSWIIFFFWYFKNKEEKYTHTHFNLIAMLFVPHKSNDKFRIRTKMQSFTT